MAELEICMLGTFQVLWDFVPVSPGTWRDSLAAKLLKLVLVKRPEALTVEEAARHLGAGVSPDRVEQALAAARRVLEPNAALVCGEDRRIRFQPGARCWIDLDTLRSHFEAGARAAARGDMFPAILAFQEADALYQGDLLEELQEAWVRAPRRELQELYTEILDRLAEGHAVLARYQDAVGFCHKALSHDSQRETTYQRMMIYYYYLGDMAGAAEAYRTCQETLEGAGHHLSAETVSLWERISRGGERGAPGSSAAAAMAPSRKNAD
jgi:DNA-binding SARP family transcriptional activator